MLAKRLNILMICLAGCIVAGLFGLWALIKLNNEWLAFFSATTFPVIGCWYAGLHDRKQLAKIAMYAALGWFLAAMLRPVTVEAPRFREISRARRIMNGPLAGQEWQIPASVVSSLLAMVGAAFVPRDCLSDSDAELDDCKNS